MESQDDPEARIRDLERPLTDRAHASELGRTPPGADPVPSPPTRPYAGPTQAYADPYPPPPPMTGPLPPMPPPAGYGAPYPGPAQHTGSGFRGGWLIVAGAFVVGAVALATSIGSITDMFTEVKSVIDAVDDTPTAVPSISIDIPTVWPPGAPDIGAPPAPAEPTIVSAGQQLSVSGIGEHQNIVCEGGTINVSGVDNNVDITGHCVVVGVSGVRNTITMESSANIGVSGFDNKVTYRAGEPQISTSGGGNSVEQG